MNVQWYTAYLAVSGEISATFTSDEDNLTSNTPAGGAVVVGAYRGSDGYIADGQFIGYTATQRLAKAQRPAWACEWSNVGMCWIDQRTLAKAKEHAWAEVKAQRAERIAGTFMHDGNTYDIDLANITGASLDAREALIAGDPWSQQWVLSNNTTVTLTAQQMIAIGRAAKATVSDLWATSQFLRAQIDAAQTAEQVAAVAWPQ